MIMEITDGKLFLATAAHPGIPALPTKVETGPLLSHNPFESHSDVYVVGRVIHKLSC